MRELKFRAWDEQAQTYFYDIALFPDNTGAFRRTNIESLVRESECHETTWTELDACAVIEQYTGLKDKNGEEIYEGDILMDDCSDPLEYWTVKHEYGKFVGEAQGVVEDVYELTDLEVIGNVHENPELLKGKDENQSY